MKKIELIAKIPISDEAKAKLYIQSQKKKKRLKKLKDDYNSGKLLNG